MNAMANLSNGFKVTEHICSIHQVQKIQAGENHICPQCAVEHVKKIQISDQPRVDQMVRAKHLGGAMLPQRHAESAFTNYRTNTQAQADTLSQCIAYAQALMDGKKSNFIMVGSTGTGKTHLGCATAKALLKKGLYVRYITSEDLAQRIMNAWEQPDATEKSVIYDFSQYDLLILDEYGLHDRDKRRELVHKVLYARYDRMKPTMLISNLTLAELQKDLGDRLWSRFQQGGLSVVACNWADARVGGEV